MHKKNNFDWSIRFYSLLFAQMFKFKFTSLTIAAWINRSLEWYLYECLNPSQIIIRENILRELMSSDKSTHNPQWWPHTKIVFHKNSHFSFAKISLTPVAINLNDVFYFSARFTLGNKAFLMAMIKTNLFSLFSFFWIIVSEWKNAMQRLNKKSKLVFFSSPSFFSFHVSFDLLLSVACEPPKNSVT